MKTDSKIKETKQCTIPSVSSSFKAVTFANDTEFADYIQRKKPKEISELMEINTFIPADNEQNLMGIGIQLIINNSDGNIFKEDYQINSEGIIYSWGKTPVIDQRSLENKI